MSKYLSVVIPAYNEEHNLRSGVLGAIYDYLKDQPYFWEVIVVDDGSADKTLELAQNFAKRHKGVVVLPEPHRGKGGAIMAGVNKASGELILFTDMDQATPLNQVEKLIAVVKQGKDIAIGSRAGREGAPFIRKLMAYGFTVLRALVLQLPYKDTQCGFKLFKRDAAKKIFGRLMIYKRSMRTSGASVSAGFDLEILYLARKLKFKVIEVPVVWHHKEGTKVSPIKDSWEGLRDLLKVRVNAGLGKYKVNET